MRGKHDHHKCGENHYRWNSSRIISSTGYAKVRVEKCHPFADPNGYIYEHLHVWLNAGKPAPKDDEIIHHVNGNKLDNRLENLELKSRVSHSVGHFSNLSDEDVRNIRELYASGESDMPSLARVYKVPATRISKYIRGESRVSAGGSISKIDNRAKRKKRNESD